MTTRLLSFALGALAAAYLMRRLWRKAWRRMTAIHDANKRRGYYQSTIEPR